MYKATGTGLMGLGVVLVVVGAVLKYAVTVTASGLDINVVGVILLSVGIAVCIIGAAVFAIASFRQTTIRENVHVLPEGARKGSTSNATTWCHSALVCRSGVGAGPGGRHRQPADGGHLGANDNRRGTCKPLPWPLTPVSATIGP